MAQVKKPEVEAAILEGAYDLFLRKGYSATSLAEIAASASISTSNIYVYFPSKLKVLFALYDPWLRERVERLGARQPAGASLLADIDGWTRSLADPSMLAAIPAGVPAALAHGLLRRG